MAATGTVAERGQETVKPLSDAQIARLTPAQRHEYRRALRQNDTNALSNFASIIRNMERTDRANASGATWRQATVAKVKAQGESGTQALNASTNAQREADNERMNIRQVEVDQRDQHGTGIERNAAAPPQDSASGGGTGTGTGSSVASFAGGLLGGVLGAGRPDARAAVSKHLERQAQMHDEQAAQQESHAQRGQQIANRDFRVEGDKDAAARAAAQFGQTMAQMSGASGGGAAAIASMNVQDPSATYGQHMARADEQAMRGQQAMEAAALNRQRAEYERSGATEADRQAKINRDFNIRQALLAAGFGLRPEEQEPPPTDETPPTESPAVPPSIDAFMANREARVKMATEGMKLTQDEINDLLNADKTEWERLRNLYNADPDKLHGAAPIGAYDFSRVNDAYFDPHGTQYTTGAGGQREYIRPANVPVSYTYDAEKGMWNPPPYPTDGRAYQFFPQAAGGWVPVDRHGTTGVTSDVRLKNILKGLYGR